MQNREIKFRLPIELNGVKSLLCYSLNEVVTGGGIDLSLFDWHGDFQLFTGLLDKNGREIYEGDIVIHENPYSASVTKEQGEIIFDKGAFWLRNENGNWYFDTSPIVIGNIFENPELLK